MVVRINKRSNEKFLGCINFPNCKFTYNLQKLYYPKCGKSLVRTLGTNGEILECTGEPNCDFIFDFEIRR